MSSDNPDPCNELLLEAVRTNNIDEVERLIRKPNISVNYDIGDGSTVLFESLFTQNIAIFRILVGAGFDISIKNYQQETPLHTAAMYSHVSFVVELIRLGVDINAKEEFNHTPLSRAAFHGRTDAMCALLYYEADVEVVSKDNMTPLMWALENDQIEAADILFHFYDDFSCKSTDGSTALHIAAVNVNPLAIKIFMKGTNENVECDYLLLSFSLEYKNSRFFKLLWSRYKDEISINDIDLSEYLSICTFPNGCWLECLYLLFTSPGMFEHLLECKCNYVFGLDKQNVLAKLMLCFYQREIDLDQRMALIYLCLSFGVKIGIQDINLAYLLYGFNEEFEALMYTLNYQNLTPTDFLPLPRFIFLLENDYKIETVLPIFQYIHNNHLKVFTGDILQDVIGKSLGYCSLSITEKQSITNLCTEHFKRSCLLIDKINLIPEMPSLLELCRNGVRQFLIKRYGVTKSYEFHAIVKELNWPPYIKDVVRFKTPLY